MIRQHIVLYLEYLTTDLFVILHQKTTTILDYIIDAYSTNIVTDGSSISLIGLTRRIS